MGLCLLCSALAVLQLKRGWTCSLRGCERCVLSGASSLGLLGVWLGGLLGEGAMTDAASRQEQRTGGAAQPPTQHTSAAVQGGPPQFPPISFLRYTSSVQIIARLLPSRPLTSSRTAPQPSSPVFNTIWACRSRQSGVPCCVCGKTRIGTLYIAADQLSFVWRGARLSARLGALGDAGIVAERSGSSSRGLPGRHHDL